MVVEAVRVHLCRINIFKIDYIFIYLYALYLYMYRIIVIVRKVLVEVQYNFSHTNKTHFKLNSHGTITNLKKSFQKIF